MVSRSSTSRPVVSLVMAIMAAQSTEVGIQGQSGETCDDVSQGEMLGDVSSGQGS